MDRSTTASVQASGLVKHYGDVVAVRGVDLTVEAGEVFGFLGPNGAGKSTTVRMLTTLLTITSGTAHVAGLDVAREPDAVRARIGVALQEAGLDPRQTGRELLVLQARLFGLSPGEANARAEELLELVELEDAADRRIKGYSGGMKRRLDLASALVHEPDVLFLDEPTTGLDPRGRRSLWSVVRSLVADGVTVLVTTQYLEEADALADRIAVLHRGRVVAEGSAPELKAGVASRRLVVECAGPDAFGAVLRRAGERAIESDRGLRTVALGCDGDGRAVRALLDELDGDRDLIADFAVHTATLDDVFETLTGHTADGEAGGTPESESHDD
jgi:ABC-2 type transport system ATP-binding protein